MGPTSPLLRRLLVPRVADTDGSRDVQRTIEEAMKDLGWTVEHDEFEDNTPLGRKKFANIIATKNPNAKKRLVLAAHFDSKYFKDETFIGATDSAVPCAIMISIAQSLNKLLDQQPPGSKTIQLIFFDGEEAFVDWTQTDSLYGSRHLAQKWETTALDGSSVDPKRRRTDPTNPKKRSLIKSIDVFVLLDLLGDPTSTFINTNPKTTWMWDRLVDIETRLAKLQLLSQQKNDNVNLLNIPAYFTPSSFTNAGMGIDDDHRPFRDRGVPIVHCIAVPFPKTWHTPLDDGDHYSPETAVDLTRIFAVLVVEYLGLSPAPAHKEL
ncbi:hypothetical protein HDU99_001971 [Rhizoclosmatium hyalinum]|nr:hypothetical protein HDU99_001971 [Rhizoclosmatium hyalinum]